MDASVDESHRCDVGRDAQSSALAEVSSPPEVGGTLPTAQCANNSDSSNTPPSTDADKCVSRTQRRKARREAQNNENWQKHQQQQQKLTKGEPLEKKVQAAKEEGSDVSHAHPTLSVRSKAARSKDFRDFLFETFAPLKAFAEAENARRADFQRRNNLAPLHGRLTEAMTSSKRSREDCAGAEGSSSSGVPTVATACENESKAIDCGATPNAAPAVATSNRFVVADRPIDAPYVLDVAGGKGEVAVPLRIRGVGCGVVDPRTDRGSMRKLMKYVDKSLNATATAATAVASNSTGTALERDDAVHVKDASATSEDKKVREDAVKDGPPRHCCC